MQFVVLREHSSSTVRRLSSTLSSRLNAPLIPTISNAAFSTSLYRRKEPRKPYVPKPYIAPPGANPVKRTKIHGSSLKLKYIDPIKVEGKRMKLEIETIFENDTTAQQRVDDFIRDKLADCDIPSIANLMRVSAQTLKKEPDSLLKSHLPAIARRLDALSTESWSFMHIAFVVYGLQHSKEKDRHSLSIVATMAKMATETLKGEKAPMSLDISMILLGLKNNNEEQKETLAMLSVVRDMLEANRNPFIAQSLSNSFYGLKGMTSKCPEALGVLSSLGSKVSKCSEDLSPQQISFALCGFQGMDSSYPEVTQSLLSLIPKVKTVSRTFHAQHVGNAMLGLQSMGSDSPDVLSMMNALLPEFKYCREDLNQDEIKQVPSSARNPFLFDNRFNFLSSYPV